MKNEKQNLTYGVSFKHWHLFDKAQVVPVQMEARREENVPENVSSSRVQRYGVNRLSHGCCQVVVGVTTAAVYTGRPGVKRNVVYNRRRTIQGLRFLCANIVRILKRF